MYLSAFCVFYQNPRKIINDNGKTQCQNKNWMENHVKIATTSKQKNPPELVWQQEVECCYYYEKENKMEGVEKH